MKKSFDITAEHFQQTYGTKPRSFIYNSSQLHELERFSSDAGVQVMIINIQAFNATGKDNRRIYDELDDFQSRQPIDVISANRPIVIIDEPQKIGAAEVAGGAVAVQRPDGAALLGDPQGRAHQGPPARRARRLQPEARQEDRGARHHGQGPRRLAPPTSTSTRSRSKKGQPPTARVELEVQTKGGPIKRQVKRVDQGHRTCTTSPNGIEAYKDLVRHRRRRAIDDIIELSNGDVVVAGQLADRDVTEETKRRIQIREVIRAHLDKERELFAQGIKVLSLFFIDEVAKYRDYDREDTLGEYARVFEEEYERARRRGARRARARRRNGGLPAVPAAATRSGDVHQGYFSIDKKTKRLVDGDVHKTRRREGPVRRTSTPTT